MKYSSHSTYINKDGVEVPSATTILQILNKPSLTYWANSMGFRRMKVADVLAEASEKGTTVHDAIEHLLMGKKYTFEQKKYISKNELLCYLNYFLEWKKTHTIEPEFMEKKFVSNLYGGTIDFFGKVDGLNTILDFKTSKQFYATMFLQLGGYCDMLEEHGYTVDQVGIIIVNQDKYNEKFMTREELNKYISVFRTLTNLFHEWYKLSEEDGWGTILKK